MTSIRGSPGAGVEDERRNPAASRAVPGVGSGDGEAQSSARADSAGRRAGPRPERAGRRPRREPDRRHRERRPDRLPGRGVAAARHPLRPTGRRLRESWPAGRLTGPVVAVCAARPPPSTPSSGAPREHPSDAGRELRRLRPARCTAVAFHPESGQLDLRPDSSGYATQLRLMSSLHRSQQHDRHRWVAHPPGASAPRRPLPRDRPGPARRPRSPVADPQLDGILPRRGAPLHCQLPAILTGPFMPSLGYGRTGTQRRCPARCRQERRPQAHDPSDNPLTRSRGVQRAEVSPNPFSHTARCPCCSCSAWTSSPVLASVYSSPDAA